MPLYETTFVVRQDMSVHDVDKLTEKFVAIIDENGGKVEKIERWGLRNLAYLIKKNRKGHFVYLGIDAPYAAVKEMERNIRLNEDILRCMTIAIEALSKEQTHMMQPERSEQRYDNNLADSDAA